MSMQRQDVASTLMRCCFNPVFAGRLWVAKDPKRLQTDRQTARTLIRLRGCADSLVFAGCICHLVGNAVSRSIFYFQIIPNWRSDPKGPENMTCTMMKYGETF